MMAGSVNEKQMVLGYAPYEKCDSIFVNKFIRFETVWTATQYLQFDYETLARPHDTNRELLQKNLTSPPARRTTRAS